MIRIFPFINCLFLILAMVSCGSSKKLFNGVDLQGWIVDVPAMDGDPSVGNPFIVRNGLLVSKGLPLGHLITERTYENYRLEVEYRFSGDPGNCGVLIHCSTPRVMANLFPQSIEVQLMHEHAGDFWCIHEDIEVPDMEGRRGPRANWGTIDGKERRIRKLSESAESPVGDWNRVVVEAIGSNIRVWVNDQLVNDGFNATASRGQIALQSEGSEVEFRKVVLTPINRLSNEAP